ncbi:MAG: ribonuclease III [Eubacterium sp.]|nr:ribonuclease III [Eubacterium sp.]
MNQRFVLSEDQLKTYSPLSFAYIGDAVYELIIRTVIVTRGNTRPGRYHKEAISYVNAAAQADLIKKIKPALSQEELAIFRRGCNAKPATTAKNQTRHDYRIATGFEALVGYLYLRGRTDRILELVELGLKDE